MTSNDAVYPLPAVRVIPPDVVWHIILSSRFFRWGIIPLCAGLALVYCTRPLIIASVALHGKLDVTNAHIILSQDTGATRNSAEPIFVNQYSYTTADGKVRYGVSYGRHLDPASTTPVIVLYADSRPDLSFIQGMKASEGPASIAVLLSTIPLAVGVLLILMSLYEDFKLYHVLRFGQEGTAQMMDKVQTRKFVRLHPVYRYFYEFTAPSGAKKKQTIDTFEWLSDSQTVLYSSKWNEYTVLVISLPGKLIIVNGVVTSHQGYSQNMILPSIAIALLIAIVAVLR